MSWWREVKAAIGVTCVVVLLAACATVPVSGPVVSHSPAGDGATSSVRVQPVPPARDAAAMLIVEGFLHAMGTDTAGYPVARQYLTEEAAAQWTPAAGAQVYADGVVPTATATSVVLVAPITGFLSPQGSFSEASGQLRHDFGLVQDADGQWRISRPPPGLLLSRFSFATNYTAVILHYLDPTGTTTVPERRFLPLAGDLPTSALQAQLAGPGSWLAPAVRTSERDAPSLLKSTLVGTTLQVELGPEVASWGGSERGVLVREIALTALLLDGVTAIEVTTAGLTLTLQDGASSSLITADQVAGLYPDSPDPSGRLYLIKDGRVHQLDSAGSWSSALAVAPDLPESRSLAVSSELGLLVAVSKDGTELIEATLTDGTPTVLTTGKDLVRPSISRQGEVWSASAGTGEIVVIGADGNQKAVDTAQVPDGGITSLRVSPDGARLAMVLSVDGRDVAGVAVIVRDRASLRVESFRPVNPATGSDEIGILDIGWLSGTELVTLVVHSGGAVSVVRLDQDSAVVDDIGPNEVTELAELAVAPGRQPVVRGSEATYRYEGDFNWRMTLPVVDAVAYSG